MEIPRIVDQNTKTDKQERPNKDEIKGLPAHAQYQFRQDTWYVYFPYCFRESSGKRSSATKTSAITSSTGSA